MLTCVSEPISALRRQGSASELSKSVKPWSVASGKRECATVRRRKCCARVHFMSSIGCRKGKWCAPWSVHSTAATCRASRRRAGRNEGTEARRCTEASSLCKRARVREGRVRQKRQVDAHCASEREVICTPMLRTVHCASRSEPVVMCHTAAQPRHIIGSVFRLLLLRPALVGSCVS